MVDGRGGDLDLFGHLAELQLSVQADRRGRGHDDVLLNEALEPGRGDLDAVNAR